MKNKNMTNIKTFLTSLVAACLFLFVIGCGNSLNSPDPAAQKSLIGKGTFSLRIEGVSAQSRTIMPAQSYLNNVEGYTLKFTNAVTSVAQAPIYRTKTQVSDPVNLEAGTYNLEVIAYTQYTDETTAATNKSAANGDVANVNICNGRNSFGTVILRAIDGGQGTFKWDIGLPDGLTTASMTITSLLTDTKIKDIDLLIGTPPDDKSGSCQLDSGEYSVVFTLAKDASTKPVIWRETLHIYQNMESYFTYNFTDYVFTTKSYTVTLKGGQTFSEESYGSATWFCNADYTPADPSKTDYVFGGWYTDVDCENVYSFGPPLPQLTGDLTLYVRWIYAPYRGTAAIYTGINSNDLLNIPDAQKGWYAKTVNGRWLEGYMIKSGEDKLIEVPLMAKSYSFNELRGDIPPTYIDGNIGKYWSEWDKENAPVGQTVYVELYIPYDSYEVWFENDNTGAKIYPVNGKITIPNGKGAIPHSLKIKIESHAAWEFVEKIEEEKPPYPVFEQGSWDGNTFTSAGIYYWKEWLHEPACEPSCMLRSHYEHWNIANQDVVILTDFASAGDSETKGSIQIRAFDIGETGVTFITDPAGEDMKVDDITPENYKTAQPYPLFLGSEEVGTVYVKVINHTTTSDNVLRTVDLNVVYDLDAGFEDFVAGILCNNNPVTASGGRSIDLTGLNHGSITLQTEFIFKY